MKVSKIIENVPSKFAEIEVKALGFDSNEVCEGTLFFCLTGRNFDGHDYADEAVRRGAVCVVAERQLDINCPVIVVEDSREILSLAASKFYGEPQKNLKMIAISGTNGKTTTAYIISSILMGAGKRVGMIGTNGVFVNLEQIADYGMTTPDPIELFSILATLGKRGVDAVVMEVSAHALALKKVYAIVFDVAAFTNLSQDHLDFFC